ncbi:MAG: tol-pal system-associated acyl-CoA thioesterase [Rhodobacteraceae bacterium]|nr:tol-pal system-associated acyl-CoA thioesterase [Paracoccaceae bacterium]
MAHEFPVRVYYEDTDMGGVVYYANYLRFIERARSEWVRSLGIDQNAMRENGIVWVVRRVEADYIGAARFEDDLVISTEMTKVTTARLEMEQKVRRGDKVIFRARVLAACMNAQGRPVRLPAEIRALM